LFNKPDIDDFISGHMLMQKQFINPHLNKAHILLSNYRWHFHIADTFNPSTKIEMLNSINKTFIKIPLKIMLDQILNILIYV
jgi:hypothetical protein